MKLSRPAMMLDATTAGAALVLTGCSSDTGANDGITTIKYWSWDDVPGAASIDPIIESFEKANPGIKVKYTEIPRADYKAKVASSLGAGEDIDVLGVRPSAWASEIQDHLLPVEEYPAGDKSAGKFTDAAIEQTERLFTDGALLAVPLYSTGSAIGVYNADILDELGVAAPTTRAEFRKPSKPRGRA
jgi:raffinose/stachyose/melibiose transport system substrate-binding protein